MSVVVPTVVESTVRGERSFDIYSRLLRDRIVFVGGEIDDDVANLITAQLLFLESEDPEREIWLYINSPGGSVTASFSIYDAMQYVQPQVSTVCLGMAASGASLLLCAGAQGRRFALPSAVLLIHQPWTPGLKGKAGDIDIHAREILRQRDQLIAMYARHSGRAEDQLARDLDRDLYLSASEARDYGLIDRIVEHRPDQGAGRLEAGQADNRPPIEQGT